MICKYTDAQCEELPCCDGQCALDRRIYGAAAALDNTDKEEFLHE